ncbi:DUF4148 domain-containing protein [Pigmentiphaga kullae]|uniref:Uncharacterized protein DUF4148 n=1 Tax=Pigmentiphaga kullae TaxID=151784 RepID=A0A4Q7NMZ4_9BURK|nr:DUF4148 domain-containing protein [Pigmentiphaga kullae]RZS86569.1 uncharacterized protein DUF4148 [Pigmentiphaga kullae]
MNRSITALIATLVIAAPGIALANSAYHDDVYNERFFFAANHDAQPQRSALSGTPQAASLSQKPTQGKTREQVREELRNISADEKRRMQELYAN